jgi:hypothetical protein
MRTQLLTVAFWWQNESSKSGETFFGLFHDAAGVSYIELSRTVNNEL